MLNSKHSTLILSVGFRVKQLQHTDTSASDVQNDNTPNISLHIRPKHKSWKSKDQQRNPIIMGSVY